MSFGLVPVLPSVSPGNSRGCGQRARELIPCGAGGRPTFLSLKNALYLVTNLRWVLVPPACTQQVAGKLCPELCRGLCSPSPGSSRLWQREPRARWSTKITWAHPRLTAESVGRPPKDKAMCTPSLGEQNPGLRSEGGPSTPATPLRTPGNREEPFMGPDLE